MNYISFYCLFRVQGYDKDYQYFDETNKKVLGKFKDEKAKSIISEFVGVRPKCCSMLTDNDCSSISLFSETGNYDKIKNLKEEGGRDHVH